MASIQAVDPQETQEKTAEIFKGVEQRLGRVPNMLKLMGHSPSVLAGYLAYTAAFHDAKMSPRLRGLLTAAIAELSGCGYVLALAYGLGQREGLTSDEVTAGRRLESSDPKVAAALRFAAQVVEGRGRVSESEVRKLQAAGYSDEEVIEILGFIGLSLVRNYFNLALGTEPDAPPKAAGHQDGAPAGQVRARG